MHMTTSSSTVSGCFFSDPNYRPVIKKTMDKTLFTGVFILKPQAQKITQNIQNNKTNCSKPNNIKQRKPTQLLKSNMTDLKTDSDMNVKLLAFSKTLQNILPKPLVNQFPELVSHWKRNHRQTLSTQK